MSKGENTFYSTHTFLYPLEFAGSEIPQFSDDWEEENRWQELKKSDRPLLASDVKGFGKSDLDDYREEMNRVLLWNTYRYFLPAVQNQLFPKPESSGKSGGEKCRIRHFRYRNLTGYHNDIWKALNGRADEKERKKLQDYCFKKLENCSQYQIETGSGEVFLLRLTGIRLSYLEKYKMGILGFETVYLGEKKVGGKITDSQNLYADAKAINDLGRRVYSPCYDATGEGALLTTAKEIRLILPRQKKLPNQNAQINQTKLTLRFPTKREPDDLPLFGTLLFGEEASARPKIRGILDDRMYTVSLIQDPELSERIRAGQADKTDLYELAFLDKHGDCSCKSDKMLEKAMEEHTYSRWEGYGTLQFVTEYAMTCVTGLTAYEIVVNPFRTMYVEMLQLALLQRAVLVGLERKAEEIAEKIELDQVKSLWEEYIYFQNTLCVREVTFQQQGIELYDMMKRDLRILEIGEDLGRKITRFESYSEIKQEEAQTAVSGAFTDIALIGTVHTILASGALKSPSLPFSLAALTYLLCGFGLVYVLLKLLEGIQKIIRQGFRRSKWNFYRTLVYLSLILILLMLYLPQLCEFLAAH